LRAGGVRRKLLTLLALLAIVIGVLPVIVAKTALRHVLLSMAIPKDTIQITIGDASLNWIGAPSMSKVEVKDTAGNTLLVAESIHIDRSPLSLAMNSRELGTTKIIRPTVHLKVRPDGSDLQDVIKKLTRGATDGTKTTAGAAASRPLSFAVQLIDATIVQDDVATGRQFRVQNVNIQYDCHGATRGLGTGLANGDITVTDRGAAPLPAGRFNLTFKPGDGGREELAFQADGVALAIAEPWLRRFAAGNELTGTFSGQGTAAWTIGQSAFPKDLTSAGTLSIDRLDAATPALAGDRVRLARMELPWRIVGQPSGVVIEDLRVRSDIGQIAIRGRLDPAALASANTPATPSFVAGNHDLELRGAIDLARLATMLPNALHIRSGTTITSGTIDVTGSMKPSTEGQAINASITTAQLAGTHGGKSLRWDQPVNANVAIRRANGSLALDSLKCDSKFLRVEATGTKEQLNANLYFDLNALAEQLGQFVDLSSIQMAGTGTMQVAWQQPAADKFSATASGDLAQLRITLSDGAIWAEPQLALRAQAGGSIDPATHQPTRVDAAQLQINGGGDLLDAQLTSPVALNGAAAVWPVTIRSSGSIARWLTRARPWFAPGDWKIDGTTDLAASVRVSSTAFEATNTKLTVTDLRATSPEWNINEPRVEISGDARFDRANGALSANTAQFVSSTVALATKDVRYGNQNGTNQLSGAAAFRADLARLGAWRVQPAQGTQYRTSGEFTGNIRFVQQASRVVGEVTATGQNLALASNAPTNPSKPTDRAAPGGFQTIWQEPRLTLRGTTNYDASTDQVTFDQFQIQSNTLQAAAAGKIQKLSSVAECNLNGTLNYDLAQVTPLLQPYVGAGIQLTGREQARFTLAGKLSDGNMPQAQLTALSRDPYRTEPSLQGRGTHWSRRVHAQLELPWSGANVYGLPVGAGRLAAKLGDGALRIEPIALAIGEGQLTAAPNVRFDPEPAQLTMPAGPVITNVRISPEVSEAMLKYVAPILAGTTQSEGLFSLKLDGMRVPLADSRRADSAGQLTVHSVRVVPGPMASQFVGVAREIEALVKRRDPAGLLSKQVTLVSVSDQQVNFRVADGRVYHQNMEFQIGDISLRSQGSVGFDQTVSLTLQIPIQDAWVAKEPVLAGLKGQSLQVPVGGTLTHPQMDQRALAQLTGQLIQKGAGQAVGNELNKALDKFLKPRQ
jgi:hypothetical protein